MTTLTKLAIDPRSGFCPSNSTFYSKRKPVPLPADPFLDVATFVTTRRHSGKIALIDASPGRHLTFPQLYSSVASTASYLSSRLGVRKGHVILLLSPNSIYFPIVALAVMSLGAVLTTTNPLNTPQEINKQISDSNPVLAFTTHSLIAKLQNNNFPIVLLEETRSVDDSRIVTTIEEMIITKPEENDGDREKVSQHDMATLLYSSGTTGTSKGVVSTHRNLISMVQIILNRFKLEEGAGEPETFLCTVPMFHVYGLGDFATGLLGTGATVVILSKFAMNDMLEAVKTYNITYLPVVPPILVAMLSPVVRR